MLPLERITAAFEHRPTDKIPIYQAGFSSRVASAVLGREAYVGGGIQQWREACALWQGQDAHAEFLERSRRDAYELCERLDLDMVRVIYWRLKLRPSERLDECTFRYDHEDGSWEVRRFDPETELYQVVSSSPRPEPTFDELEREVERQEKELDGWQPDPDLLDEMRCALAYFPHRAVPGVGIGICVPRERLWLEAIVFRPDLVARLLEVQAKRAVCQVSAQVKIGLRFLMGGGDFASNHGPLYSPKAFHELMLPRLQSISAACHAAGAYHMFASDGDLWPVAEDLFGASGVDCFYEIDVRAGMSLERLRERFPHLTLMGGINSYTLHRGTKEDVIREARAALDVAKARGSIIVGCSNQIVPPTPIENFWAMMDTLHRYR